MLIGFFLWIHTHTLLEMEYIVSNNSTQITKSALDFSIKTSIERCATGRAYMLIFLIITFSVIAPYVKLGILYLCWNKSLETKTRVRLLEATDIINKWAFIDMFVLCLLTTIFSWDEPIVGNIILQIIPQAKGGMYMFSFAIIATGAISQYMIHIGSEEKTYAISRKDKILHTFCILLSLLTATIGIYVTSVHLIFTALTKEKIRDISLISTTYELINGAKDAGMVYIILLMAVLSWFSLFVYAGAWVFANEKTPAYARNIFSWCTVDVLFAALLVTSIEFAGLADAIAENACGMKCFVANTSIGPGIWYLFVSTISLWVSEGIMRRSWKRSRRSSLTELPRSEYLEGFLDNST